MAVACPLSIGPRSYTRGRDTRRQLQLQPEVEIHLWGYDVFPHDGHYDAPFFHNFRLVKMCIREGWHSLLLSTAVPSPVLRQEGLLIDISEDALILLHLGFIKSRSAYPNTSINRQFFLLHGPLGKKNRRPSNASTSACLIRSRSLE